MVTKPIRLARVASMLLLLLSGCGDSRVLPPVDPRYSEFLSVLDDSYRAISGSNSSTTVGVLQIFAGATDDVSNLREVTRGDLVFESRQREVIDRLVEAIQQAEPTSSASCDLGRNANWILVAYDSALFRAGVIRLYACGGAQNPIVGIRPVGDAAITYSRAALDALKSLGLTNGRAGSPNG